MFLVAVSLAGWSLIVAIVGLVVAALAFLSNRSAIASERADRLTAFEDAWAREWAAQRPLVYPVLETIVRVERVSGLTVLPLKNGGHGPALNVVGRLAIRDDAGLGTGSWCVSVGTLAAGDAVSGSLSPSLAPPWAALSGSLTYGDLAGGEYETPFEFSIGSAGQLELVVGEQQHRTPVEVKESTSHDA